MIKNVVFYNTACSFSKIALSVVSSVTSGLLAARRAADGEASSHVRFKCVLLVRVQHLDLRASLFVLFWWI